MGQFLDGTYYNEREYCHFEIVEKKTGRVRRFYGKYRHDKRGDYIPKKVPKGFIYLSDDELKAHKASRKRLDGKIVEERFKKRSKDA